MVLQWGGIDQLPARVLYEDVLPSIVESLTSSSSSSASLPIPYHRGSPYGGKGWDTADPTIGDVHQWNVWGGKERPWQEYESMGGRFVRCVSCSILATHASWLTEVMVGFQRVWYAWNARPSNGTLLDGLTPGRSQAEFRTIESYGAALPSGDVRKALCGEYE